MEKLLKGVDIVLSLVNVAVLEEQKKVFQAAKNVGVQRVVPSEFAIPCPPERELHLVNKVRSRSVSLIWQVGLIFLQKRAIGSFIKELGIGYTIIDVGWWMELILPFPSSDHDPVADLSRTFVGAGDVKTAVTSRVDIGRFIARILADPRTLNRHVFCHAEEVTQTEVYQIAEEISGENFGLVKNQVRNTLSFI